MIMQEKNYDVIILTHAPNSDLVDSIVGLINQTTLPNKIIIYNTDEDKLDWNVKGKSGLTLAECVNGNNAHKFEVVHIKESEFDHGKARNDASKLSSSKYILFMTDDAIPYHREMCERMMQAFEKYDDKTSKVATVYARQIPKSNASLKERYVREYNYPNYDIIKEKSKEKELGIKNYYCSNVCAMYDRDIFNKLGRFEENIILNEDTFYVYNAIYKGYKVVYCSEAKVLHSHNLSFKEQFNRNFDIGVSQRERREIFDKIPSTKEGKKMVVNVSMRLLKGFNIIEFINFIIECIYRYMGFKRGYNFEKLSLDECIKCASNKNYFIKKK